jgi:dTDP-4-dehydrorhamnose reductase
MNPIILATGPFGLVGRRLLEEVPDLVPLDVVPAPPEVAARSRPAVSLPPVDITDAAAVVQALETVSKAAGGRPVVVIHLAALTDTKGEDPEPFERVNVRGTENVLRAASKVGARFIHISTDYVFAGESREGAFAESDRPAVPPPGPYAASKFRAENLVLDAALPGTAVARIAFPYGGVGNRPGLEEKMIRRFEAARLSKTPVELFRDQTICPSYIPDVVKGLLLLVGRMAGEEGAPRVVHLVGDPVTPLDFGREVSRCFDFKDVALKAASVRGTPYAANLRLSSKETRRALSWIPTSHKAALAEIRLVKV